MTAVRWVLLLYGLFNIVLGVQAYISAGSRESLMGGVGAGVVVIVAMVISFKQPRIGYILALFVCFALFGRFMPAFLRDGTIYPAFVVAAASALTAGTLIGGHLTSMRERKSG